MAQSGPGYRVKTEGVNITLVFQGNGVQVDQASGKYLMLKQFQAKKTVKIRSHFK